MSVINNVLKDLESKPSAFTPLELEVNRQQERPVLKRSLIVWVGGIGLLVLLGWWYIDNASVETVVNLPEPVLPPAEISPGEVDAKPLSAAASQPALVEQPVERPGNAITGLQINETSTYMELEFQLLDKAQSYLRKRSNNRYVFLIEGVENTVQMPEISHSPWLERVTMTASGSGVEIDFDTRKNVLVSSGHRREQENNYWAIRFKKPLQMAIPSIPHVADKPPQPSSKPTTVQTTEKEDGPVPTVLSQPAETERPVQLKIRPAVVEDSAERRLKDALLAASKGQYQEAETKLNQLLGSDQDREARLQLVGVLARQNQQQRRSDIIREGYALYPKDVEWSLLEAGRLFREKQYRSLVDQFSGATANLQMLSLLGASFQRTGQHARAVETYQKALAIDPRQGKLWISLAISQQHEKQIAPALHSYRMATRSGLNNDKLKAFVEERIRILSQAKL